MACAELVGDELVADEADDAREERGQGEEKGRGGGGVAVRGMKKSEGVAAGLEARVAGLGSSFAVTGWLI